MRILSMRFFLTFLLPLLVLLHLIPVDCSALEPDEVLVVANRNASKSVGLGKYYMEKRKIPAKNFLALWVTDKERCSREMYDKKIAKPIRRFLSETDTGGKIRCIVMMYGVPLKVSGPEMTKKELSDKKILKDQKSALVKKMKLLTEGAEQVKKQIKAKISQIDQRLKQWKWDQNKGASVDSEIALVMAQDYPLTAWLPNPFYLGRPKSKLSAEKDDVLMVSRLDGPSDDIVRRIIDDSIFAERKGLTGSFYMDARWPAPKENKKTAGYGFYDRSIHRSGNLLKENGVMPGVIESTDTLFQPGQCPDAALYCGWYSLSRYVDAFEWQRGAVGYHIASGECGTLKINTSRQWCIRMILDGIAATIGPVGEPYVQAFPVPEVFFKYLVDGYLTLAECYFISLPYLSWKMVLVGDPLYRPFKNKR